MAGCSQRTISEATRERERDVWYGDGQHDRTAGNRRLHPVVSGCGRRVYGRDGAELELRRAPRPWTVRGKRIVGASAALLGQRQSNDRDDRFVHQSNFVTRLSLTLSLSHSAKRGRACLVFRCASGPRPRKGGGDMERSEPKMHTAPRWAGCPHFTLIF